MIIKLYGSYVLICDNCEEAFGNYTSFADAVTAKKKLGIVSVKIKDEWQDTCQECAL